jgi:ribosomal protein L31
VIKTIRIRRFKCIPVFEMPVEMKARYKDVFKVLHHKIKKGTALSQQDSEKYDSIILHTPTLDLCKWTSQVLAVIDKESEIEEERKKKSSGGLLSYFWGSSKQAPPPSGDIANLFEEIETNEEISEILVPKEYITLQFHFTMEQGRVELKMKRREAGDIMEGLTLEYQNIEISLHTRTVGFDLFAKVQKCVFFSWEEGAEPLIIAEKSAEVTDPLWTLDMKYQHPKLFETSNTKFISTPLMFYFEKQALRQVVSFFVIPHARDTFKTAAWDTLQEIQDSTQGRLTDILTSTSKHIIHLELSAPKLRIPAGSNAFMIDLGEINLNNDISSINESYETLSMQIGSLEMNYICNGFPLPVIPPFSINGNVSFIKSSHKLNCSGAHIELDLDLPEFNLILSPITYSELLRLNSAFSLDDDIWNGVTTDKSQLIEKAELIDIIQKQGQNFKSWHQYFAILSGGYIYFFLDSSDTYSTSHFYIKDCSIEEIRDENEPPNTMRLENRYGTCVLSFATEKDMNRWWKGVDDSIQKMKSTTSVAVNKAEILSPDLKWLKLHFLVSELTFTLTNQRNDPWADLKILAFSSDMLFRPFDITGKVLVKSVWVEDARKESTFHFKTLATSKDTDTELINIDMEVCSPSSPLYNGSDAKVDLTFGELLLNWNPDLLTALFNFFEFSGYSVPQEPVPRKTLTNPNTIKQPNPDHILLDVRFT